MNILITGGAGFLGAHLCARLIKEGHSVICLDNFITGSKNNIADLLDNPKFKLIEHDISSSFYPEQDLDWVLHFASIASPKFYLEYPIKTLKSGLLGTHNCLGIAKDKKAKFFLASTSEVYGDPEIHPQTESYNGNVSIIGPRSCYDESKRGAESLTYAYRRQHGVDVRVARIFNTYGPKMQINDGRVISNFIIEALNNTDITVYGDGSQTRSFCYVDDLIEGMVRLMKSDYDAPINLGNPFELKIGRLAEIILKLSSSKAKINFLPLPEDDPRRRRPDISKAKEILDWQPQISLEEGLEKTISYFKSVK